MVSDQVRHEIGTYVVAKIKLRTARGVDFKGNPFEKYSESYKKKRDKKGLPTDKVDLNAKGHMMAALDHSLIGDDTVLVHFDDQQQAKKAHGHNFRPDLKFRRFMGINNEDVKQIRQIIEKGMPIAGA